MKKIISRTISGIVALTFLAAILYSCDSKQHEASLPIEENSTLLAQLSEINSDFAITHPRTKAPSNRTKVVAADIEGAIIGGKWGAEHGGLVGTACGSPLAGAIITGMIGGLVFGGLQSYLASSDAPSQQIPPSVYDDMIQIYHTYVGSFATEEHFGVNEDVDYEQVIVDNSELVQEEHHIGGIFLDEEVLSEIALDNNALKVGQLHNIMLAGLNKRIPVLIDSVATEISVEDALVQSQEFRQHADEIYNNFDINNVFSANSGDGSLPEEVMTLYWSVFESNVNSCTDIVTLINNYSSAVMNSDELSDQEKEWVQMGLAVSIYSYNYWNQVGIVTEN